MSDAPLLVATDLCCTRPTGGVRDVSVAFEGKAISLFTGETPNAGHHLCLRLLALLDAPEAGGLTLKGEPTEGWNELQRAEARNRHYGYLFRSPFLLPAFNVVENIAIPCFKEQSATPEEAKVPTRRVMSLLGLEEEAESHVEELSLTTQHRVALARALVMGPEVVAIERIDEVLHDDELISFLELLAEVRDELGTLFLISTQTPALAGFADRVLHFRAGQLVEDRVPKRFFS